MTYLKAKIGIISSNSLPAQKHKAQLQKLYNFLDISDKNIDKIDTIIALGGDGLMLHLLHKYHQYHIPIYGLNYGTFGFLMNNIQDNQDILQLIDESKVENLYPLKMISTDVKGKKDEFFAINEVSLFRKTGQTARIAVEINGQNRVKELHSDGILLSTPAGSTAYNRSIGGPIIPLSASLLALTPISPFFPRNWKGALLPNSSKVKFTVINESKRPVNVAADFNEIRNIKTVEVEKYWKMKFQILFNKQNSLEEKIIREQFL
jgi:NAD+ kinase